MLISLIFIYLFFNTGTFGDNETEEEQIKWTRRNVKMLYEAGAFSTFVELLNLEVE